MSSVKSRFARGSAIALCLGFNVSLVSDLQAQSSSFEPSASDFGGVGLLQTRTARFWPDGQADVAFSRAVPYSRYNLSLQALPWLEATFRYTSITNQSFDGGSTVFSGSSFKDRAFDAKALVLKEGIYRPQIAVGFQDLLGTGLFSGEYVVASKRLYDFDFSLGLGWGYNAGTSDIKNPLTSLSDSFKQRGNAAALGGTPVLSAWFSGPNMGVFGGVEYNTPLKGLSLKLEYDPNNYQQEPNSNVLAFSSHWNFGVNYRPFPWIEVSLGRERGELWMTRFSLRANFNDRGIPKFDPPPPALKPRVAVQEDIYEGVQLPPPQGMPASGERSWPLRDYSGLEPAIDDLSAHGLTLESVSYTDGALEIQVASLSGGGDPNGESSDRALVSFVETSFPDASSVSIRFSSRPDNDALAPAVRDHGKIRWSGAVSGGALGIPVPKHRIAARLFEELDAEGLAAEGFELRTREATLYFAPSKYRQVARSFGRAARVVANNVPQSVEFITLVAINGGMEVSRVTIMRSDLEAAVAESGSPEEIWARARLEGPSVGRIPSDIIRNNERFPTFGFSAGPRLRQHIGSRDGFYLYQLWLALSGSVQFTPGLSISGTVGLDVTNNFDRLTVEPPASSVPRVRSFIKEYLQQGQNNLVRLQANYLYSPLPDVYTRFSAGFFEDMYGGFGGEVLYRPFGSRFAAGIDLNYVRQRDFDQRLAFRNYSVATGHLNLYYDIPYQNLLFQTNVGRFLAGDVGSRFQVSRLFDGGVRVGAWATFTDIPAAAFGEGSFDKGFFIVVPFDLLSVRSTTRSGAFSFRPLTKDGGQLLGITPRLYDVTAGGNLNNIAKDWNRFLD